jgi:hypothetical protein
MGWKRMSKGGELAIDGLIANDVFNPSFGCAV